MDSFSYFNGAVEIQFTYKNILIIIYIYNIYYIYIIIKFDNFNNFRNNFSKSLNKNYLFLGNYLDK